ncbi:hypothetical protein LMG28614_05851 [Paraburkholderia ultramafica]|uniref:Uncharacterized protein n=1 Tax=Paraburkholderia ultramafica TaxID=1544867 RepID=A0A6S7C8K0_9BURK|nr:hypothetical protein [Paraburkholderia ultramafica]CAB3803567.1 hypothetical protein LMG28614_05851 [Paraburkholderia ultramafica]
MDRLICAQSILEAMRMDGAGAADGAAATWEAMPETAMRRAVELLARRWPEDYPAGAVEWLIAGRS